MDSRWCATSCLHPFLFPNTILLKSFVCGVCCLLSCYLRRYELCALRTLCSLFRAYCLTNCLTDARRTFEERRNKLVSVFEVSDEPVFTMLLFFLCFLTESSYTALGTNRVIMYTNKGIQYSEFNHD
jgi:hypothetical protein